MSFRKMGRSSRGESPRRVDKARVRRKTDIPPPGTPSLVKPLQLVLLIVGVLLFLAGLTFTLQGYGVVGPSSGFMYQNKTWVFAGATILVIGLVIAYLGFYLGRRPHSAAPVSPSN